MFGRRQHKTIWKRAKADVEVSVAEWLPEWNLPPPERRSSRPYCSVHWSEGAEKRLLPGDKVFQRNERTDYKASVIYLLERRGKIVARSEQVLWQMVLK